MKEAALEEENNRRLREQERRVADRARENAERVEERKAVAKKVETLEEEKGWSKRESVEKQGKVNELGFDDAAISSIEEVTGGKRT